MPKASNLVGKRFGELIVENKCNYKRGNKVLWQCKSFLFDNF